MKQTTALDRVLSEASKRPRAVRRTPAELAKSAEETVEHSFHQEMIERFGPAGERKSATRGELWGLISEIIEACGELATRVQELEARPNMKYFGVWEKGTEYPVGAFATHHGSVWHANITSKGAAPGDNNNFWQLAVKRGSSGKARP